MDYKIYHSKLIQDNHQSFIKNCEVAFYRIKSLIESENTTWNYNKYNIFSITSSSLLFYNLFKELNSYIRNFIDPNRPIWLASWLNYHPTPESLDRNLGKTNNFHGHNSEYHGYISIDPQNTITKFRNKIEIQNKPGQVYIGPGSLLYNNNEWDHYVEVVSPITKPRITIAFDINLTPNVFTDNNLIPLL